MIYETNLTELPLIVEGCIVTLLSDVTVEYSIEENNQIDIDKITLDKVVAGTENAHRPDCAEFTRTDENSYMFQALEASCLELCSDELLEPFLADRAFVNPNAEHLQGSRELGVGAFA